MSETPPQLEAMDTRTVVVHEAGHAVMALRAGIPFRDVVLVDPMEAAVKAFRKAYRKHGDPRRAEESVKAALLPVGQLRMPDTIVKPDAPETILLHLAGMAAEEVLLGDHGRSLHGDGDMQRALRGAQAFFVEQLEDVVPVSAGEHIPDAFVAPFWEIACATFREPAVCRAAREVADALLERKRLRQDEVRVIVERCCAMAEI